MTQKLAYAPAIAELLAEDRLAPLGPGTPNTSAGKKLKALSIEELFAPHTIADRQMARACLAGLWLYHDFLNESHIISQEIDTPTGSYWHGLMHRREPDFSNSAYWFRRVGAHPIFPDLCREAAEIAEVHGVRIAGKTPALGQGQEAARFLVTQREWDPFAFIDLCQGAYEGLNKHEKLCREIQRREWELLFDWCYREAVGLNL